MKGNVSSQTATKSQLFSQVVGDSTPHLMLSPGQVSLISSMDDSRNLSQSGAFICAVLLRILHRPTRACAPSHNDGIGEVHEQVNYDQSVLMSDWLIYACAVGVDGQR